MEGDGFLEDADYYDDFGFTMEPDCIQKSTRFLPAFLGDYLAQGSAQQRKIKCGLVSCVSVLVLIFVVIVLAGFIVLISHLVGGDDATSSSSSQDNTAEVPSVDVPSSFTTNIAEQIFWNGKLATQVSGFMSVDNESRNSKINYTEKEEYGPYTHDSVEYLNTQNMKLINNGICRYYPQHYNNIFSWVPKGEYMGKKEAYGQSLDWFSYETKTSNGNIADFQLLADGNTPVVLNVTVTSSKDIMKESIHFTDFQEATIDPSVFQTPDSCVGEGIICDGGSIETMDMILFSPTNDTSLMNKNTGDLNGAAGSICEATQENSLRSADFISLYSVEVNTAWGQYGICYNGYCNGANTYSVGRAASFRVKDQEGQCSDNSDTGSWFSLVAGAQCTEDQQIEDGTCSWKVVSHQTTITGECLKSHGFVSSCESDPLIPFTSSAQILQEALNNCENVSEQKLLAKEQETDSQAHNDMTYFGALLIHNI
mmetsp:Transcript_21397/g.27193  ORF Transcript_21397/g.27193 Transcript_21397/m.27193 type:complete len:482 (-) Transcript_21397:61-1506(-)